MPRKILVLYAHPSPSTSRANRALRAAIHDLPGVTLHDLYETYPDFFVDVAREQALPAEHDVLVLQHPLYWDSSPALVKGWCSPRCRRRSPPNLSTGCGWRRQRA